MEGAAMNESAKKTANDAPPRLVAAGRVELIISVLLRTGVLLSLLVIIAGLTLTFAHHPQYLQSSAAGKRLASPDAEFPHSLGEMSRGLLALRGQAMVVLGLLMLIATPILRVAVSIAAFAIDRDWTYVAITTTVLLVLLLSFFLLGKAG
jgi:uncharacterized membrane protein